MNIISASVSREILTQILVFSINYKSLTIVRESVALIRTVCSEWRTTINASLDRISSIFGLDICHPVVYIKADDVPVDKSLIFWRSHILQEHSNDKYLDIRKNVKYDVSNNSACTINYFICFDSGELRIYYKNLKKQPCIYFMKGHFIHNDGMTTIHETSIGLILKIWHSQVGLDYNYYLLPTYVPGERREFSADDLIYSSTENTAVSKHQQLDILGFHSSIWYNYVIYPPTDNSGISIVSLKDRTKLIIEGLSGFMRTHYPIAKIVTAANRIQFMDLNTNKMIALDIDSLLCTEDAVLMNKRLYHAPSESVIKTPNVSPLTFYKKSNQYYVIICDRVEKY